VAIEADLDRIGKVRAELDKERPEVLIQEVEVIVVGHRRAAGDPRVRVALASLGVLSARGAKHRGLLLGLADEQHPLGETTPCQILLRHVVLALSFLEADHIEPMLFGEALDGANEPLGHGRDHGSGGDRIA
jgi:hypothetical protein